MLLSVPVLYAFFFLYFLFLIKISSSYSSSSSSSASSSSSSYSYLFSFSLISFILFSLPPHITSCSNTLFYIITIRFECLYFFHICLYKNYTKYFYLPFWQILFFYRIVFSVVCSFSGIVCRSYFLCAFFAHHCANLATYLFSVLGFFLFEYHHPYKHRKHPVNHFLIPSFIQHLIRTSVKLCVPASPELRVSRMVLVFHNRTCLATNLTP